MRRHHPTRGAGWRRGFTLVELLVVMGIILVLATLAVAFVPRVTEHQRTSRAASQLQGWLSLARGWALRDQAPRGIRITYDPTTNRASTLYYIEQPDDWTPSQATSTATLAIQWATLSGGNLNPIGYRATLTNTDPTGGMGTSTTLYPVQPGDYLELDSRKPGNLFQIINVTPTFLDLLFVRDANWPTAGFPAGTTNVTGFTQNYQAIGPTNNYRVVRAPRVRTGEAPLQMMDDTAIDFYPNSPSVYNSPMPVSTNAANSYDIIFMPSGGVFTNGVAGTDLRLWVVDTTLNTAPGTATFSGQPLIVTVALRSGFVSVQPVDVTMNASGNQYANPYSYNQDGRTSGF